MPVNSTPQLRDGACSATLEKKTSTEGQCRASRGSLVMHQGRRVVVKAFPISIDVAAFVLSDKQQISVKPQPNDPANAQELLRIFRTSGCGYFTTILGPGSNAAHEEHLHFDYGMHGKTMNYRICE